MAAESTSHAQQSFKSLAHSQAASADTQQTHDSNKQTKVDEEVKAPLRVAEPTANMLPVELLLEIFAELNTVQLDVAKQVCRTWRAVADGDARLWRKLAFTPALVCRSIERVSFAQAQLRFAVERADNKVTSVDLTNLPCDAIDTLCDLLYPSTQTLRHILWSPSSRLSYKAERVCHLAKRCPRLQTLELRSVHTYWSLTERFTQQAWGGLQLDSFSVTNPLLRDVFSRSHPPMIYDQARALSVAVKDDEYNCYSMIRLGRVLRHNRILERLTLHGLWEDAYFCGEQLDVLALKHLNIRERDFCDLEGAYDPDSQEPSDDDDLPPPPINAPRLRELVADARLLSQLTSASIVALDSVVLYIGWRRYFRPQREWTALRRVKFYEGSLGLVIATRGALQMLSILSREFLWPQLKEVDIELDDGLASMLLRLVAARQAGALGASKEQYMSFLQEAPSQRTTGTPSDSRQRRLTSNLGLTPKKVDSADIITFTSCILIDTANPPLCSDVAWKIKAPANVPTGVINWLRAQSNVELTVAS